MNDDTARTIYQPQTPILKVQAPMISDINVERRITGGKQARLRHVRS